MPAVATQEGLLAELPRPAGRVLFAAGEGARRVLPDALGADVVVLYRTRELTPKQLPVADLYVLGSASTARALAAARTGLAVVSIGPETSRAARERAWRSSRRRRSTRAPGSPRPSRRWGQALPDDGCGGVDSGAGVHHVPHRLRAPGRLRRHLPRSDQAICAPDAQIIDITHGIPPQAVLQGALVLANTLPYMPVGVHLAVVDPGVGGHRRALALRDAEGRLYVGPDNGLAPAGRRACGHHRRAGAREPRVCARVDLADLSRPRSVRAGRRPPRLRRRRSASSGPPIDPEALVRLDLPEPSFADGVVHATTLYVDSFGNIALNLTRDDLERVGAVPGTKVELELAGERYYAVAARTFADARAGDVILYEDSYRNMSIAISNGNAAAMLHAVVGRPLSIRVVEASGDIGGRAR